MDIIAILIAVFINVNYSINRQIIIIPIA